MSLPSVLPVIGEHAVSWQLSPNRSFTDFLHGKELCPDPSQPPRLLLACWTFHLVRAWHEHLKDQCSATSSCINGGVGDCPLQSVEADAMNIVYQGQFSAWTAYQKVGLARQPCIGDAAANNDPNQPLPLDYPLVLGDLRDGRVSNDLAKGECLVLECIGGNNECHVLHAVRVLEPAPMLCDVQVESFLGDRYGNTIYDAKVSFQHSMSIYPACTKVGAVALDLSVQAWNNACQMRSEGQNHMHHPPTPFNGEGRREG